jgi:PH (Pleckstrin Homology) domain-containing protein
MTAIQRTVLKHPNSAYLIVAFVALCVTAVVRSPVQALVYLIPAVAAGYVARTATVVDERGLRARALLGSHTVSWDELRGLRLDPSGAVYAVDRSGGQLRLPCVRSTKLQPLIDAGGGRLPQLPAPPVG